LVAAACAALASCDQGQQQTAQTAPAAPTCACRPTAPEETAAVAQTATPIAHRHHHRRHSEYASYSGSSWSENRHGDYSRTDFTQSVLAPYNYVSQSRVAVVESEARYESDNYANGEYRSRMRGRPFRETVAATMTGERLDPWHGYDVYCPER
jgi:hypothetical protein